MVYVQNVFTQEMNKMQFIYEDEGKRVEVTISNDRNLDAALINFGEFLKAVGYVFEGEVVIDEVGSNEKN